MKKLRFCVRLSEKNIKGLHAQGYGLRVGYWPCLLAPYVQISFAKWNFDFWYGLESYKINVKP